MPHLTFFLKLFIFVMLFFSLENFSTAATLSDFDRLEKGEIIAKKIFAKQKNNLSGTEAKILIKAPPEKIWNILGNQENLPSIIQKVKKIQVLEKNNDYQKVQTFVMVAPFLPLLKYTSIYDMSEKNKRIKFNRTEGCLKDVFGEFIFEPGKGFTVITCKIYVDSGLPEFICRQGIRQDVVNALRMLKLKAENSS